MAKAGCNDLHHSALESPWAAWISEKVRSDLEVRTRAALTEKLNAVASQKAQEDDEQWRQKTEELVADLRRQMDGVKEVAAAEAQGKAQLETATARHSVEEAGLDYEVDDLQERKAQLERLIESDRRRHAAERAVLERGMAEDAEEGATALHVRADEAAVMRDNLDFVQQEHSMLPQNVLQDLQWAWDSCSPEWGTEFKAAMQVCKQELRHFHNKADFKVARERLSRNFRVYHEHNAVLGSPDAVMHSEFPQLNAAPGEKIYKRADEDAPTQEISEPERRVLCALLANDVLLDRIHQRQLLQRTHRTPRTRAELDLTWWKGSSEPPDPESSARRGRLGASMSSSRSARRAIKNSSWR
eukprot:gnl/MRDRNA2_/MRDRNA2_29138_c0_seq1.p1 gnl/MRDRNA2_/MRDRNA2_29138_c0~~gnl/MRDRNA2_/MRDRNA2_29138_c0_seq1.p1  ORF type:complete len:357 (-),score=101.81 gnl/MRDRNA2_/MRDRNA2_29138_c0_seq1:171-1241(-)